MSVSGITPRRLGSVDGTFIEPAVRRSEKVISYNQANPDRTTANRHIGFVLANQFDGWRPQ
jgi:hypothetical protein